MQLQPWPIQVNVTHVVDLGSRTKPRPDNTQIMKSLREVVIGDIDAGAGHPAGSALSRVRGNNRSAHEDIMVTRDSQELAAPPRLVGGAATKTPLGAASSPKASSSKCTAWTADSIQGLILASMEVPCMIGYARLASLRARPTGRHNKNIQTDWSTDCTQCRRQQLPTISLHLLC